MNADKESPQDGSALTAQCTSFICPKCHKPIQVRYEIQGTWQVYPAEISCPECKKDISRFVSQTLISRAIKFKRTRTFGRMPVKPTSQAQSGEDLKEDTEQQEVVVEPNAPLTFEEACKFLKPRELAFVLEYVKDFNGSRAATMAGYSPKTARIIASQILTKLNIQRALVAFFNERKKTAIKTVEDIERRLEKIAFSPILNSTTMTTRGSRSIASALLPIGGIEYSNRTCPWNPSRA